MTIAFAPTQPLRLVVITGGRDRHQEREDALWLRAWLLHLRAQAIVHGDCRHTCGNSRCRRMSVDRWSGLVAQRLELGERRMPAEWHRLGRAAGPARNIAMLELGPVAVLAFPGPRGLQHQGRRTGTGHTVYHARARGIETLVRGQDPWPPGTGP